jgi:hypothetical protein
MDNLTIKLKIKQRLNKLASDDYDNIQDWQIVEAFNKGSVDWCRRQLHGTNVKQTGDEQTKRRIDDLQILLREFDLNMVKKDLYYGSENFPTDYFEYKRVSFKGKTNCCESNKFVVYLVEEANVDLYLKDPNLKPSFDWGETFLTMSNNEVKVYTNNEFDVIDAKLAYYKQPTRIEFQGVTNPYTGLVSPVSVESEFKDDIIELLIDESVKILAGDIEYISSVQIADKSVEGNN